MREADERQALLAQTGAKQECASGAQTTAEAASAPSTPATLGVPPVYRATRLRWYILVVYTALSCWQCVVWLSFSSVPRVTKEFFVGMTDADVTLLLNYGCIIFVPASLLVPLLASRAAGLRYCVIVGAVMVFLGSALRLVPCFVTDMATRMRLVPFVHVGQVLNAVGGPIAMGLPAFLSLLWFPANQRLLSTVISGQAIILGSGLGFLLAPVAIQEASQLPDMLYLECAVAFALLVCVCVYFPARPSTPPSPAAEMSAAFAGILGTDDASGLPVTAGPNTAALAATGVAVAGDASLRGTLRGIGTLLCNARAFVLCAMGGLQAGVYNGWVSVLPITLSTLFDPTTIGFFIFGATAGGIVASLVMSRVVSAYFPRHLKFATTLALVASLAFSVWITVQLPVGPYDLGVPRTPVTAAIAVVLTGTFSCAATPMFYEIVAEAAFPVSEGTSAVLLVVLNNLFCLVFLFVVPAIPATWVNLIASCLVRAQLRGASRSN